MGLPEDLTAMPLTVNQAVEKERENYERLRYVCYETAPTFLRGVFQGLWKCVDGTEWKDNNEFGRKLLRAKGVEGILGGGKKFQRKNVESGNCNLWDLSLLADIINVLTVLRKDNPTVTECCSNASFTKENLESLKGTRNKIAHAGLPQMNETTFQPLWDSTFSILTSMGMNQGKLEKPISVETSKSSTELSENAKRAECFKKSGNELFGKKKYSEAALEYSQGIALEHVPQELLGTLYSNRSVAFLETGHLERAKDDAKSCVTLRPTWCKGYTRLGMAYEKMKKYSKAVLNLQVAIRSGDKSKKTLDSLHYCKMMKIKMQMRVHLDPNIINGKKLAMGVRENKEFISGILGRDQTGRFSKRTPGNLCLTGVIFDSGYDVCIQDYEKAVEFYAQAASMGYAGGLVRLAVMTREGKGVQRDMKAAHQMLLEAAGKEPVIEDVKGSGKMIRHEGVREACYLLGQAYQYEIAVELDEEEALKWYHSALEYGSGESANNIGCMFAQHAPEENPDNYMKIFDYFRLGAFLGSIKAMEQLAINYLHQNRPLHAQEWYQYALQSGSLEFQSKPAREKYVTDLSLEKSFDPEKFRSEVEEVIKRRSCLSPMLERIEGLRRKVLLDEPEIQSWMKSMGAGGRSEAIRRHRMAWGVARACMKQKKPVMTATPADFLPTSSTVDFEGLKEIFFKDMEEQKEDTVYTGRLLKLIVIEDASLENTSIRLLVEDGNGDVGRLYLNNYPQRKETNEEIGYGCRLTIFSPYYGTMDDGLRGLRVDDPELVFKRLHMRNPNRCRYCGKAEGGKVKCRKCRRVKYCSKDCLEKDAKELLHSQICFKTLFFN